tara:strand:- start:9822 stop:10682 length:861 start_codon:yes stop_codon:yes gene_type:complete
MITFDMLGNYGELGNQFFQIAVTSVEALKNETNAVFPRWQCGKSYRVYSPILRNPLDESLVPDSSGRVFHQDNHNWAPIPFKENMNLRGYFQSEKYWEGYFDYVRDELFTPAQYIVDHIEDKYKELLDANDTVGVHIRSQTRAAHDAPTIHLEPKVEYLKKAFAEFGKNKRYVIFSDNIPLMRHWFKDYDFTYIENGTPNINEHGQSAIGGTQKNPLFDNVVEMYLLSRLKDQITTSSSFGWWGAWLNKNPDKRVISMHEDMWFGDDLNHLNLSDLIPNSWQKIKS